MIDLKLLERIKVRVIAPAEKAAWKGSEDACWRNLHEAQMGAVDLLFHETRPYTTLKRLRCLRAIVDATEPTIVDATAEDLRKLSDHLQERLVSRNELTPAGGNAA